MSPVSYDERNRKSAVKLPHELTNESSRSSNATSSSPLMKAPTFTHASPKSKHTSGSLLQHILEGFQSQCHQPRDPSPTDSHPHARPSPRSHSRHRTSRSSETVSAILLITNERLSQETARASEAERQGAEILAHFKSLHQAKQKLEIDFQRVKDELRLYKNQLDVAQAEIRRAQEIVDKVDRQRADAEDEARRGREKVRKLMETRAVELAMEEGRRLGYEEGMKQGRQSRDNDINQPTPRYYPRTSFQSGRDDDDDQVSYFSYMQEERHSPESSRTPTIRSTSLRRTSDARHPGPILNSGHGQETPKPDTIAIHPHTTNDVPTRPISVRNHSPTISRRSSKIPPDGYIPIVDANSFISIPPPHEFSTPVPPESQQFATMMSSDSNQERKKGSTSRSPDRESRRRTPRSVDRDSTSHYTLSRQRNRSNHPGPKSEASTNISESSLLGPPDDSGDRIESKRRYVKPDIMLCSTPPPPSAFLDHYNESTSRMLGNFNIERPKSTDPIQRSQSRTARRPREIVLPTLPNSNIVQKYDHTPQETANKWQNENNRPSSAGYPNGNPPFVHRSTSNITVPGIEIQTPSSHTSSIRSGKTVVDPVLLTPESANRPIPLPLPTQASSTTEEPPNSSLGLYFNQSSSRSISGHEHPITMTLPDNNLPPGFIPLSPIPGMKNFDSYSSGFAPSISKLQDEYPDGHLPSNFSYPSSPIIR